MFQDEIRDAVADAYRSIDSGAGRAMAEHLYDDGELAQVPDVAPGEAHAIACTGHHPFRIVCMDCLIE